MAKTVQNIIIGIFLTFGTYYLLGKYFPKSEKKFYEVTLSNGKVLRDSLKEYEDRLEGDSISYYKNQIISSKEIK